MYRVTERRAVYLSSLLFLVHSSQRNEQLKNSSVRQLLQIILSVGVSGDFFFLLFQKINEVYSYFTRFTIHLHHEGKQSMTMDPSLMFRGTTVRNNASIAPGPVYSGLLTMSERCVFFLALTHLFIESITEFFFNMKNPCVFSATGSGEV